MDNLKNYWRLSLHLGIFFVMLFIICFIWFFVIQAESLRALHMQMWQMFFFGYSGANFLSFISGVVQSFVWAYVLVGLWLLAGGFLKKS